MISKEKYEKLKEEFGQKASWAVWAEGDEKPYIQFVKDLSVFSEPDLLDTLHNNFVVVGSHPSKVIPDQDWANFHAGRNDFKYRYGFKGTPIWGAYMTDFYSNQSVKSEDQLMETDNHKNEAIEELIRELTILGGNPILISLGENSESNLLSYLKDEYDIYYMEHPGNKWNNVPKETVKARVLEILEEINMKTTSEI